MPDYQQMYLEMVRGTERAINILIDAQRKCEEIYIKTSDSKVKPLIMEHPEESESPEQPKSYLTMLKL